MVKELMQIMQNEHVRKEFGARVKSLRKQKNWTQKKLANELEVRFSHLNKYESGLHIPPIEKLITMADIFGVTLDYLITGDHSKKSPLYNKRLLERFKALEAFSDDDQETIIKLIDAMILKQRVEGAVQPVDKK